MIAIYIVAFLSFIAFTSAIIYMVMSDDSDTWSNK